ncbi:MAG: hypothetical protein OEU95_06925 [Nitrospirota bacterium]|nr:hypothetical protein [Nitrospirota bacterium]
MRTIEDILEQIQHLEKRLSIEIQKKEEKFLYKVHGKRVRFEEAARQSHKNLVTGICTYISNAGLLNIITSPVIWFCLVPAAFLDLVATIYQFICFPAYKIPKVRREEFIIIDHHSLAYLNIMEKLTCVYCSYFNGLIAYVQEIAARTEQYWCPIKHARKIGNIHSRYKKFLEYGDAKGYRENIENIRRDFKDLG